MCAERLEPTAGANEGTVSGDRYIHLDSPDSIDLQSFGYHFGKTLGSGTYGKVKATWYSHERKIVAVKVLSKLVASHDYLTKFLPREKEILQRISHPGFLTLFQIIESKSQIFFVMELASNGDLLDYINARRAVPEPESRAIFRQIVSAVAYLHSINITHRDLKCENIMLTAGMAAKIGDFGFSFDLSKGNAHTPCGSYSYAAPELFAGKEQQYNPKKTDCWSIGVILYAMVCGRLPFGDDNTVKRMHSHVLKVIDFRNYPITDSVKDLIRKILNHNIKMRLDTIDMLTHKWNSQYASLTPAPIYADAKHTIERCFNPPLAAHIRSMMDASPSFVQSTKTGLRWQAPGMTGLLGTKCADAIHHSYR